MSLRPLSFRAFHDVRVFKDDPRWSGWQVVIGIETHAQLKSRRKLFSDSLTSTPNDLPNKHVSPFDAAFPGTLPKINPNCVDLALRTALALRCQISLRSSFDRKHYFYPDLPAGYQITQQYSPLARNGELKVHLPGSEPVNVRIKQIQLEQDTGKSTFDSRSQVSFINLNRAGTGLMEIVSEPDLRSPEEAGAYVRALQTVLRAMGSSDGNMEQGSLRCDVNVSVNKPSDPLGTRCEIKNLNSVKFMMAATAYEIKRQCSFLLTNPGATLPQETRGFNEDTFETYTLRSKEDAPDYRYMPDANLGSLVLSQERLDSISESLPSLPWEKRAYLLGTYPELRDKEQSLDLLLKLDTGQPVGFDGESNGGVVEYFEQVCRGGETDGSPVKRDPVFVLNWVTHDLLSQLSENNVAFNQNPVSPEQLGQILDLVSEKRITGTSARYLLRQMVTNPSSQTPLEIAFEQQFINSPASHSDDHSAEIQSLCAEAISALPQQVSALRSGESKGVINKIVGYVMKQSRGRADAVAVKRILEDMILGKGNDH